VNPSAPGAVEFLVSLMALVTIDAENSLHKSLLQS